MDQMNPSKHWIPELQRKLPLSVVKVDEKSLHTHGGDAWHAHAMPEAVVEVRHEKDIQATMRIASKYKIPVTARGSGRGYVGSCVPVKGGISLSLTKLNKILEVSAKDSLAVVQPGVITERLQIEAKRKGLFYPPDPASLNESSIGGNIATNAGGPRCLKYGVTKNYVMGLNIVLPNGELVKTGGRCHKNKLGFNLVDLFPGSEGMLGIISLATLRLIPHPPARSVLVASFSKVKAAAKAVTAIQQAGYLPCALEIADKFTLEAARGYNKSVPPGEALIIVELDGQAQSVHREIRALKTVIQEIGALQTSIASTEAACEKLWDIRRSFSYSLRATGLIKMNHDVVVPRGKLTELFKVVEKIQQSFSDYRVASFGHAGDGNIHVNLMIDPSEEGRPRVRKAIDMLFASVLELDGTITGEHGVGLARKPWWNVATSRPLRSLHHTIKNALDPHHLLNPGKFLG
ncbi:MAG: FAD-linked oxidase C-terminal domain-containing protein [Verrucomicrobiota bacterium]